MPADLLAALATDEDTPTSFLNPALLQQADAIARRKAVLQQQAIDSARQLGIFRPPEAPQEQPGWTSAVTGTRMVGAQPKTPILEGLRPLIAGLVNERAQSRYDNDASGYQRLESEEARKHLASMPQAREETYASSEGPAKRVVEPTDAELLAWAQKGMQIPALATTMKAYIDDQLVKKPERDEARAFRRYEAQQTRASREAEGAANRELRATIAAAMAANHGGDKASNYQIVTDAQGNATRVNKLTNEAEPVTAAGGKPIGRQDAAITKTIVEGEAKVKNAREGLVLLDSMDPLLDTATSSGAGTLRDQVYGFFGQSTGAGDAAGELAQMGAKLTSMAERMPGQVSDADLKFLAATTGGLGDPNVPASRKRAVIKRVRDQFERAASAGGAPPPTGNLRRDIENAAKANGYTPPPSGSVDTSGLKAEWAAEKDPGRRAMIEQRILSVEPSWRPPAAAGKKRSINDLVDQYAR